MKQLVMGIMVGISLWVLPALVTAEGPCAGDLKKFCEGVRLGGGRFRKCLKDHEADLSPACKAHLQSAKGERGRRWQACRGDAEKFCKDSQVGGGAIATCLRRHETELSAECKAQLQHRSPPKTPATEHPNKT